MTKTKLTQSLSLMLLIGLALLPGCGDSGPAPGPTLDKVTFNMSWLPQGSMSGVIVAMEKGFYQAQGLEVEAMRGFGGIRTVNELDQGMFDFGYGDPLAVILNRSNGGKTKMIGAINNRWPAGLCFVKERFDIKSPADLKGLTIGGGQNSPVQVIVPEWLERNGLKRDDVKMLQLDPAIVSASLIEGTIDVGECWQANSLPVFRKRAQQANVTIGWLEYAQFNLDIYGNGLVASEKLINDNPDLVRRFVQATYEGYQYALAHVDESTDILLKHYPVLDKDVTREQVTELADLIGDPATMGWMEEARVASTLDFLAQAYDVKQKMDVNDVYTTQFITAAAPATK
ncbi:MAG: ABC transporter substrate-binding protein [Pseudomonadales bacterium]